MRPAMLFAAPAVPANQPAPAEAPPADAAPPLDLANLEPEQVILLVNTYGLPVLKALIIFIIALLLAGWAKRIVRASLTRARLDITLTKFLGNAAKWGVLLLAGLAILGIFGIQTASFAVVLGALGLAIGLAFQGTLSSLAAGIMLLVFRPYKVGDVVNLAGVVGKVDEIELFFTFVDTFDNRRLIIPNADIFGTKIENITFHTSRRVDVDVGVAYSASIDDTRAALQRAIERVEKRLPDADHMVWLNNLADSAVTWQVRVWVAAADWGAVRQDLTQKIKESLDEAGISIPFPQLDVHFFRSLPMQPR